MTRQTLRNAAITAVVPLGIIVAYAGWAPHPLVGGTPAAPVAASGGLSRESVERLAPLLGTWELAIAKENVATIKLLRADPSLASELGFEAPFVCTWVSTSPGRTSSKPRQLLFVDPAQNPPRITFQQLGSVPSDGDSVEGTPGIYRVEGDTLTICTPIRVDGARPSSFELEKDAKTHLQVYRRVTERAKVEEKRPAEPTPRPR